MLLTAQDLARARHDELKNIEYFIYRNYANAKYGIFFNSQSIFDEELAELFRGCALRLYINKTEGHFVVLGATQKECEELKNYYYATEAYKQEKEANYG